MPNPNPTAFVFLFIQTIARNNMINCCRTVAHHKHTRHTLAYNRVNGNIYATLTTTMMMMGWLSYYVAQGIILCAL